MGPEQRKSLDPDEQPRGPRSDEAVGGSITQTSLPGLYFIVSLVPEATAPAFLKGGAVYGLNIQ